ncbi:hypothetical protein MRO89_10340 [Dickeya dianthicola]|uniref:hypothetical protein n=1 Tax=Dickeya dianthicola TaxID=204039 RepID=UPI001F600076|nr:hypothetical protein [Dickeya dianthicola]MCI4186361.1 hypothetical protein [Dickeya dianthicola]
MRSIKPIDYQRLIYQTNYQYPLATGSIEIKNQSAHEKEICMRIFRLSILVFSVLYGAPSVNANDLGAVTIRFIDTFAVYPAAKNLTEENSNACVIETTDGLSAYPGACSKHIGLFLKVWEAAHPNTPYAVEENGIRWGG